MNNSSHNKLVSFIWSIADDYLCDVYVRGKQLADYGYFPTNKKGEYVQ